MQPGGEAGALDALAAAAADGDLLAVDAGTAFDEEGADANDSEAAAAGVRASMRAGDDSLRAAAAAARSCSARTVST